MLKTAKDTGEFSICNEQAPLLLFKWTNIWEAFCLEIIPVE